MEALRTGHRERLRERFLEGRADAMPDYELMELVLFAAIPRRDVKPLAKQLLSSGDKCKKYAAKSRSWYLSCSR